VERLAPVGYRIDTVVVGGMSSSTYNAKMIADAVEALELEPDDRLVLLGYSKGAPDILLCEGGDLGMVSSLRRSYRMSWLAANPPPAHVRTFSLASFTDRPHVARLLRFPYDQLVRIDARNDGQVISTDQIVPGSTLLGYANADHWAVAMALEERRSFWMSHPGRQRAFPRAVLLEAILRFVAESLAAEDGSDRGTAATRSRAAEPAQAPGSRVHD
jgi:hypothetical protein